MKKVLLAVLVFALLVIPSYAKESLSKQCRKVYDLGGTPAGKVTDLPWGFGNITVVSFGLEPETAVLKVEMPLDLLWETETSRVTVAYHLRQGELESIWLKDGTVLSFYWKYAPDSGDSKGQLNRVDLVLGWRHPIRRCTELCDCQ